MAGIPSELTSSALTALGFGGTWFGIWLARKGKREDNKVAQANQSFTQMVEVAAQRLIDNGVLRAERDAARAERDAARAETDQARESWEARWERQMNRCRGVTDSLVRALSELQKTTQPTAEASDALQLAGEHNQDDHPEGV